MSPHAVHSCSGPKLRSQISRVRRARVSASSQRPSTRRHLGEVPHRQAEVGIVGVEPLLLNRKRAPEQRLGADGVALLREHFAQRGERDRGLGRLRTCRALAHLQHASTEVLGLVEAIELLGEVRDVAQRADRERMLDTEQALAHLERAPEKRLRGGVVAAALEVAAEHRHGPRRVEVIDAEFALLDRQRTAKRRLGHVHLAPEDRHARKVRQRARGLDVVGPVVSLAKLDHRLRERAQGQGGMGVKVVGELRLEPGCEGLRVGVPAMVVRLGQRTARRRRHVLGALNFGARAPEGTDTLVTALALLLQHAAVGDLVQQVVLERVLARVDQRVARTTNCFRSRSGIASTASGSTAASA